MTTKDLQASNLLLTSAFLLAATALFRFTDADLAMLRFFYSPGEGWYMKDARVWTFLYAYGNVPAFVLAVGGLLVFLAGYGVRRAAPYRRIGLFLVLFLALGPGLVVNAVFKDHWGRARPLKIEQFGGTEKFRPVWEKGRAGEGKSFPSGHASVGFFLMAPYFWLRGTRRRQARVALCVGVAYGVLMGVGRMAQGGHFPSDVLWAGAFVYLTGLLLALPFRFGDSPPERPSGADAGA